jgi:Flp pilus assembly protein TadG
MTHLFADKRGDTSIEFVIVASALLVVMFSVLEVGRALWDYEIIQEVASEGARCAGLRAVSCSSGGSFSSSATTSFITALATSRGLTVPAADVTPTYNTTCNGNSGVSKVQISYTFHTVVSQIIPALNSHTFTAAACFPDSPTH